MNNLSPLYNYDGQAFTESYLKKGGKCFADRYAEVVRTFSDEKFLKIYCSDGQVIEKTFLDFAKDVDLVVQKIKIEKNDFEVLVTIDGNTYFNCLYIVAGILCDLIICPISPHESFARVTEKLSQIQKKSIVYAGDFWSQSNKDHGYGSMIIPINQEVTFNHLEKSFTISFERPLIYIFTSGSTGYSKIVQQPERAILSNVDALIKLFSFSERRYVIATAMPIYHVNTLEFSFFCSLLSGQHLILYEKFNILEIIESFKSDKVQIFSANPPILQSLSEMHLKINQLPIALEYCLTAASSLSPHLAEQMVNKFKFKIIQGYGLSEAANFSLMIPPILSKEKVDYWLTNFERPSVGTAVPGNIVKILNPDLSEVNEGETGDICIRGHNVMIGYKNAQNADVFKDDYLHTADRGFFRHCFETNQKFFFITGRTKDVIKRFGHTISLVEIDDYLTGWKPLGLQAIAVPFENKNSGEEIGVVVSGDVTDEQMLDLKYYLVAQLPSWTRPRILIATSQLLRTESGKPKRWTLSHLFDKYAKDSFPDEPIIDKIID